MLCAVMLVPVLLILFGLILLVWSADRFVAGAAAVAKGLGMPSLLIGMVIIGFGTSAPELVVSAISAANGNPGLALGNAFGSNIANIALILGVGAIISPICIESKVLKRELPGLAIITIVATIWFWDGNISRWDGIGLLVIFGIWVTWTIIQGLATRKDNLSKQIDDELADKTMSLPKGFLWLGIGLIVLIASSRMLVTGAVDVAKFFGVSDMLIGLTIVAIGTSLPELAATIVSCLKKESDLALGNIIGSNLFNTLAVVGVAGSISPMKVNPASFRIDLLVALGLTLLLFALGYGIFQRGKILRPEGIFLILIYSGYIVWLTVY